MKTCEKCLRFSGVTSSLGPVDRRTAYLLCGALGLAQALTQIRILDIVGIDEP